MRELLNEETYIVRFEGISDGYRAEFKHPEMLERMSEDVAPYEFCDVHYTLLPMEGRHKNALYSVRLRLSADPTDTPGEIGDTVSSAVLDLETLDEDKHILVRGWDDEENLLVRHLHFSSWWDGQDAPEYEYLTIELEYLQRTRTKPDPDPEYIEDCRQSFQEQIDRFDCLSVNDTAF
ncbi:hypothetical protein SAMN05443574_1258 [Haloarcula vallismortis]|uniref:Uncharacterized protein n=2 Tax=Haloarcula vallismortis TaxID=28442 RepID=M0JIK1_HALVA|nr:MULTISPECIES: hypothetical protein [Haloarcula]EMA07824.1 hypothetical protein C437_08878 [Haloarcula vallismortis ATCC 29715]SDX29039.1 hypothetical protein SAMN05443574_1258 [Haloarcula vallismortis]